MAHIHTQPGQYDLTVSAYILTTDPEPSVLLHRHKTLNVYIQPGGHVELDENPWQALCRELREETGYGMDQLTILQPRLRLPKLTGDDLHPQPVCLRSFPFGTGGTHFHTDLTFAFLTDSDPHHPIDKEESHDFLWLTRSGLLSLPSAQTYEDVRQVGLYIMDTILTEWAQVPTCDFR